MPYMLLIVEPLGQREVRGAEGGRAAFAQMQAYAEELRRRGVLLGVNSLAAEATRLQQRGPQRSVIDGPFAETKELVGGYFLIDVATREEALECAAACPAAAWASVEVRRIAPCYE